MSVRIKNAESKVPIGMLPKGEAFIYKKKLYRVISEGYVRLNDAKLVSIGELSQTDKVKLVDITISHKPRGRQKCGS